MRMIIEKVKLYKYRVPLVSEFRISFESMSFAEGIIVEVETSEGVKGYGEASPAPKILGSTMNTTIAAIKDLARAIIGKDLQPEDLRETLNREVLFNGDAKAALEIAFMDAWSRTIGLPLYKCLGGSRNEFITDITIGIKSIEETISEAQHYIDQGFKYLKIKLGESPDKDILKIKELRNAIGYDTIIKVDANQGWTPKQALKVIRAIERYEIELVEQPLPYWMLREHEWLRRNTEIPIALDESVHTARDAYRALSLGACDVINIKLMKAGGIMEALRIARVTEAASAENMIGCMVETRLGITAAAHVVAASRNIVYIDLDADLTLKEDPVKGGVTHEGGGVRRIPNAPGLGVELDYNMLEYIGAVKQST